MLSDIYLCRRRRSLTEFILLTQVPKMNQFLILSLCALSCVQGYYYQHHYKDGVTLVKENLMAANEAFRRRDIIAWSALETDDVEIIPPGFPPAKGKKEVAKVSERLFSDKGPKSFVLRFESLLAECGNMIIVRDSGQGISAEGNKIAISGVSIYRLVNGVAKLSLAIWNSDNPPPGTAPQAEPTAAPRVRSMGPYNYHQRHYYRGFPGQPENQFQGYRGYYNYHPYPGYRHYATRPDPPGHGYRYH